MTENQDQELSLYFGGLCNTSSADSHGLLQLSSQPCVQDARQVWHPSFLTANVQTKNSNHFLVRWLVIEEKLQKCNIIGLNKSIALFD